MMRLRLSTWVLALIAMTAWPITATARPWLCLPPIFEAGQRLIEFPNAYTQWLPPLLRQHELCWRRPASADEKRVGLFGSSGVLGYPLPVELTFGAEINRRFDADGVPAHLFNLAWLWTYQLRDALIIHNAVPYEIDVLVYATSLADFIHVAPMLHPPGLVEFFKGNSDSVLAMAVDPPSGLAKPLKVYGSFARRDDSWKLLVRLHEIGTLTRRAARQHAFALSERISVGAPRLKTRGGRRRQTYDCESTKTRSRKSYSASPILIGRHGTCSPTWTSFGKRPGYAC